MGFPPRAYLFCHHGSVSGHGGNRIDTEVACMLLAMMPAYRREDEVWLEWHRRGEGWARNWIGLQEGRKWIEQLIVERATCLQFWAKLDKEAFFQRCSTTTPADRSRPQSS